MRDALRKQEEDTEFDNLRRVSKVPFFPPPLLLLICPAAAAAYLPPRLDAPQVREEHNAVFQAQLEVILRSVPFHIHLQPQSPHGRAAHSPPAHQVHPQARARPQQSVAEYREKTRHYRGLQRPWKPGSYTRYHFHY
jgi:hypothetical protein